MPENLESIGDSAFAYSGLTSVTIPSGCELGDYEENPFRFCSSLTEINVDEGNSKLSADDGVLYDKNKTIIYCYPAGKTNTSFTMPDTVTTVWDYAFAGAQNLESFPSSSNLKVIKSCAFDTCNFKEVNLPEGLEKLGDSAFAFNSYLSKVYIPASLSSIGYENSYMYPGPFQCCSNISITIAEGNEKFYTDDGALYYKGPDGDELVGLYKLVDGNYAVKEGVVRIWGRALENQHMSTLSFPNTVLEVGQNFLSYTTSLENVVFPENLITLDFGLFELSAVETISIPSTIKKIDDWCFTAAENLRTINFAGTKDEWDQCFKGKLDSKIVVNYSTGAIDEPGGSGDSGSGGSGGSSGGSGGSSSESASDNQAAKTAISKFTGSGYAAKQKVKISELFTEKFNTTYSRYTVSPKGYASFNKKGVMTVKKAGKITVTGYIKDGKSWKADKSIELTVEKPAFSKKKVEATYVGATIDMAEYLTGTTIAPTAWKSSKTTVAEIDEKTGIVTAKAKGTTTITALYGSGSNAAKYNVKLKVNVPVLSKTKATAITGATLKLKLKNTKLKPEWRSSDEKKATVDTNGKVTALAASNEAVKITARLDGVDYNCELTISPPVIKKQSLTIKVGKTGKVGLKKTKLKSIEWKSSDPTVASVDSGGTVRGIKAGTAVISTTTGGVENKCTVTVR